MAAPDWLLSNDAQVDHFRILRPLGKGGMAEIYLARDTKLGRKVALKVIKPGTFGDRAASDRFLFEARATARLNHPNIVTVHQVGEIQGQPYLALEYVSGPTLRERMEQSPPDLTESMSIGANIADALAAAHRKEILHGDLKPENVILAEEGPLRVLDFGLARVIQRCSGTETVPIHESKLTSSSHLEMPSDSADSAISGSPAYMAPEQWKQGEVSGATDVWALGVVLHELLAGRRPFDANNLVDLAVKVSGSTPAPAIGRETPPDVEELVQKCLSKEPSERPQAAGVAERLRNSPVLGGTGRPQEARRKLIGIAIAILLVLTAGIFLVSRLYRADTDGEAGVKEQPIPIIAVLPFQATGSDDGGFLASGLHGDLLTRLGKLKALRVISQTSVKEYANTTKNVRQIGEELGAGYIVEGGIQARGKRIRINAQLIDAREDTHVWAETYDRELTASGLFEVQAELALAIATKLQTTLSAADRRVVDEIPTRNIEAYNAYLRGSDMWANRAGFTVDLWKKVVSSYREAVRLDPKFALAWAHLASMLTMSNFFSPVEEAQKNLEAALSAIGKARLLQPGLVEAELAWAEYLYRGLVEYDQALKVLEALRGRSPGSHRVLKIMAFLQQRLGRYGEAYKSMQTAQVLVPRDIDIAAELVHVAIWADNCKAASKHLRAAMSLAPDKAKVRAMAAYYELECTGDASKACGYFRDVDPVNFNQVWMATLAAYSKRDFKRALEFIDMPKPWGGDKAGPNLFRAITYVHLGREADKKAALDAVAEAFAENARKGEDKSGWFASGKAIYHALRNEPDATKHWLEEEKRRTKADWKNDSDSRQRRRMGAAGAFARAGFHDEAVSELRAMFEAPGGFGFRFMDALPTYDVLDNHPGYIELRKRFGNAR